MCSRRTCLRCVNYVGLANANHATSVAYSGGHRGHVPPPKMRKRKKFLMVTIAVVLHEHFELLGGNRLGGNIKKTVQVTSLRHHMVNKTTTFCNLLN
jgi:hypothetical protein